MKMTKDYVTISTEELDILGYKVKAITERFSDEYLDSNRFESRCLRCCFNPGKPSYMSPCICQYIRCDGYSRDLQIHFELVQ